MSPRVGVLQLKARSDGWTAEIFPLGSRSSAPGFHPTSAGRALQDFLGLI